MRLRRLERLFHRGTARRRMAFGGAGMMRRFLALRRTDRNTWHGRRWKAKVFRQPHLIQQGILQLSIRVEKVFHLIQLFLVRGIHIVQQIKDEDTIGRQLDGRRRAKGCVIFVEILEAIGRFAQIIQRGKSHARAGQKCQHHRRNHHDGKLDKEEVFSR